MQQSVKKWLRIRNVAALLLACSGMSCADPVPVSPDPAANGAAATRREVPPAPSIETFQAIVAAESSEAERRFWGLPVDGMIADAHRAWRNRFLSCEHDDCRRAVLSDQLNRIEYATGRNASPLPGLPWATGSLNIQMPLLPRGYLAGALVIWPIIDDKLLVALTIGGVPTLRWSCEIAAQGRLTSGNILEMRALDSTQRRILFQPLEGGRWSLDSPARVSSRDCGDWRDIEGIYDVDVLHWSSVDALGSALVGVAAINVVVHLQ